MLISFFAFLKVRGLELEIPSDVGKVLKSNKCHNDNATFSNEAA